MKFWLLSFALYITTFAAMSLGAAYIFSGCAHLSQQDKWDLTDYQAAQAACIAATPKDKAAIDACRARVKADWCAKWAERFDGGVCN